MTFEEILHWCIFRSPKRTAKSAAEIIGINQVQFGMWRNHSKTQRYPTDEQCVLIGEICDLNPYTVWLAVQYERVKADKIRDAIKLQLGGNSTSPLRTLGAQ